MPKAPEIAINGRFLTQLTAGVQRFAVETVKAMDHLLGEPAYSHLKGHIELVAPAPCARFRARQIPLRRAGRLGGYAWEQIEFPFLAGRRLMLNLCMLGPIVKRHQIVVIHDATTKAMPRAFARSFVAAYDFIVPILCRRADLIVSVSDFSRREIGKYYDADISKIPICYEGADHITQFTSDNSIIDKLDLKNRPFFLGVGINAMNKNLESAIAALFKADIKDALLIVTGNREIHVHDYLPNVAYDNVRTTGHISDGQLRSLYEHALAMVYPSFYEGFGLPPVEAMQCGCPVIVSDQEALVEIGGDATLRCGMNDVDGLAKHMRAVYSDSGPAREAEGGRPAARQTLYLGKDRARIARFVRRGCGAPGIEWPTAFSQFPICCCGHRPPAAHWSPDWCRPLCSRASSRPTASRSLSWSARWA